MVSSTDDGRAASAMPVRRRFPMHVVVPLVVLITTAVLLTLTASEALRPATPVRVQAAIQAVQSREPVVAMTVSQSSPRSTVTVQAPGWLEADPYFTACTALADGVVDEILVLEGDPVNAGDVVARLVDDDARLSLMHAESELDMARANLTVAEADAEAARTDWEHPVERDRAVDAAKASLIETEAEHAQLPALIDVERAMHERMQEELRRSRKAFESGAVSDIELIIIEKRVEAQAATLEALRRREPILQARAQRLRAEVVAAERNATLRISERQTLRRAEAGLLRAHAAVANAEAARREAQLRLDRMVLTAPITGFVQRRLKVPGDKVMLGMDDPHSTHVVHLYDPAKIQVRVDVPLADAANIFVGQTCEVVVDVLPDDTFAGEVTRITHEADLQKNTLQVKVRVIDPSPLLRPEMLTRVKFLPDGDQPAGASLPGTMPSQYTLVVATSCLFDLDAASNRASVWIVRDRRGDAGVAERVEVEVIGTNADGWATISSALQPGSLVAVNAPDLRPGQRVKMIAYGAENTGEDAG